MQISEITYRDVVTVSTRSPMLRGLLHADGASSVVARQGAVLSPSATS